jgi:hypothetical protein
MKSEFRRTKAERIPKLEIRIRLCALCGLLCQFLRASIFGFLSDFVIRPSGLCFLLFTSAFAAAAHGAESATTARQLPPAITLEDFKITGDLSGDQAAFTLIAIARVEDSKGGSLELLSGAVALTEVGPHSKWQIRAEQSRFVLVFERGGRFPIQVKFNAAVREHENWKSVDFQVAPSALQAMVLRGLPPDTQFNFPGAARPERKDNAFLSFLPPDGAVKLSWKQAPAETEGKLFYSTEMLSQITVSPGLMRQAGLLNFKVMQGELNRVTLSLRGPGEVTRVQGDQVLAWNVEPTTNSNNRRLVVQLNQPQKDQFALQVQMQTPLGAFPQSADAMRMLPEGATRFSGYMRIVNDGAVRLEVPQAGGLSQISPEQFPETDATRASLHVTGSQRFAYRLSGPDFALRIQADQFVPDLGVSELLLYHLGENELAIDAEFELEIRDAPLRELTLLVPKGYSLARMNAQGMSDYFLREQADQTEAELRLVYGQPVTGRMVVQLRLEKNKPLGEATWTLPRVEVAKAKSLRGHVAASADPGFRLTSERTQALTEIATAFFPRKVAGIQAAFRLSDSSWQAALHVERLPQAVQADALHLFSVGEGIAYGSSLVNYSVSGAPMQSFKIELSDEYFNVEFTGKDIRNWQKTDAGYVVHLHTPVSGAYTLLATYERPFKSQGETLGFTGARPLDAQSEQGHTVIISAYQFQVSAAEVSQGLLRLETGEVPPEYRLFFDAPILAAYRYTSRPFSLKLALSPLAQGDSLSQVVDRASLTTRISKEGQVLTEAHYFIKNRGNPHFRLTLPPGNELWSATVNGAPVVPVTDGKANLIPLPQRADPNAVLTLDLQLATRSNDPKRVSVSAPVLNAPVLLAEWKLQPDTGQRLSYRGGQLTPLGGVLDVSGFAGLVRTFTGDDAGPAWGYLLGGLLLLACALVFWSWSTQKGVFRFSERHIGGSVLGAVALFLACIAFHNLAYTVSRQMIEVPRELAFLAPIQQSGGSLTIEVSNLPDKVSVAAVLSSAWPALLALMAWLYGWRTETTLFKSASWILGWLVLAWATLRSPNGAVAFLFVLAVVVLFQVLTPALRRVFSMPRQPKQETRVAGGGAPASAVTSLLLGFVVFGALGTSEAFGQSDPNSEGRIPKAERSPNFQTRNSDRKTTDARSTAVAESLTQEIRVEDKYALATAKIRWQATKGEVLPLLTEPAVMTRLVYPSNALDLVASSAGPRRAQELVARKDGVFDITFNYQVQVAQRDKEIGFISAVRFGLINRLEMTLVGLDVDVVSTQAVSVQRQTRGSNTVATFVLSPASDTWIGWRPRSRDVRHEKPVFYAELSQLYAPAAGVIEGVHLVAIRPAQGELSELSLTVPAGATVTDVLDARPETQTGAKDHNIPTATASIVSLWRYDPETRKLRVNLKPAQSRPFALLVRTQATAGTLPWEQSVGLLGVESAAGEIGLAGVATGNEVQLDAVTAEHFSPINLEDFPGELTAALQAQIPGLTVRRAFRYTAEHGPSQPTNGVAGPMKPKPAQATGPTQLLVLKASAVEPDVRVETQDTLSLGEDRTVLAVNASVDITRAGIFRLSFLMPAGFDVDSISGSTLSHWTELKTEPGRVITLHLPGKTEGRQQFTISLAGPGVKAMNSWPAPQVVIREASKQRGTLLIVPEQGLRLQVAARDGLTQLDPQKSGIRQKGVLAFRILQTPWSLGLTIEQFEPWIQVTSLQHATISEAQVKIIANLQYQIENTGLKAFRVLVPTNAEGVRFLGEQVADFLPVSGAVTNDLQEWEVKLHRRVIGPYVLQVTYQTLVPEKAPVLVLRGVQALGVNLQRGFVTVQSGGRLQVSAEMLPEALQPTEWQSVPRALKQDLQTAAANFAYRLVEPSFRLPLKLGRHEAAKLLPARVNSIAFNSVISDDGVMLTQARLELLPGDKRLLYLTLPKDAHFWFAFVNQNGVWPWREQDRILIPLEQAPAGGQPVPVEIFFSSRIGATNARALDLELLAPKFDLPLENISWRVSLSDKWRVEHWSGSLQLQQEEVVSPMAAIDLPAYLNKETAQQQERTKVAEQLMAAGNSALGQGNPQQARRAFQAAYGLTTHDAAFNEDARVQLHNIKLQEALVGLNVRQAASQGDVGSLSAKFRDLRSGKELNYSQEDAKDIIDRNTADENAAFMKLAERLIQQQDAAVSRPAALKATIPEQGRVLMFRRAVVVDPWADLRIRLATTAVQAVSWAARVLILASTILALLGIAFVARKFQRA